MSTIVSKPATTDANLNDLVRNRWSPRIYDPNHTLTQTELEALGEAFRWAPSPMNLQPWKLVILERGTELHTRISQEALGGFNGAWAPNAAALAIVLGEKLNAKGEERNPVDTAYDLGLASMKLIMQSESMGLKSHVMGGIDRDKIAEILNATDHFVMVAIAIGKQAPLEGQDEAIITREQTPRVRKDDAYLINKVL